MCPLPVSVKFVRGVRKNRQKRAYQCDCPRYFKGDNPITRLK